MQALVATPLDFRLPPAGFVNRQLLKRMGTQLGLVSRAFSRGGMSYGLPRLPLHGLNVRISAARRYRVVEGVDLGVVEGEQGGESGLAGGAELALDSQLGGGLERAADDHGKHAEALEAGLVEGQAGKADQAGPSEEGAGGAVVADASFSGCSARRHERVVPTIMFHSGVVMAPVSSTAGIATSVDGGGGLLLTGNMPLLG